MGAFKTPPTLKPTDSLTSTYVQQITEGLFSDDPVQLKATIYQCLHPYCSFDHQLAKVPASRWDIFRVLMANATLFDTRIKIHDVFTDPDNLKAVVLLDQCFQPRVPLRKYLILEVTAPTVVVMSLEKESSGLFVKDIKVMTDTQEVLAGIPPLKWAHGLIKSLGTSAADTIADGLAFGSALRAFAAKQLNLPV